MEEEDEEIINMGISNIRLRNYPPQNTYVQQYPSTPVKVETRKRLWRFSKN